MKVFVGEITINYAEYSDDYIVGVFETEEQAKEWLDNYTHMLAHPSIREVELPYKLIQ